MRCVILLLLVSGCASGGRYDAIDRKTESEYRALDTECKPPPAEYLKVWCADQYSFIEWRRTQAIHDLEISRRNSH